MENTLPIHHDINLVQYLTIGDCKNLKNASHDTIKYIYHNFFNVKNNAANVIKKFLKYSHNLFVCSKNLDCDILYSIKNKNTHFFKNLKFITINLLYLSEYDTKMANEFIKGLDVEYKKDLILKTFNIDFNKKYNKYDLNYVLTNMDYVDIFTVGF